MPCVIYRKCQLFMYNIYDEQSNFKIYYTENYDQINNFKMVFLHFILYIQTTKLYQHT
jgi:hypothetical protein